MIWLPMLAGDSREQIDRGLFTDPRAVNLWDPQRIAGSWLADHRFADLGSPGMVVWDAYFAFDGSGRWRGAPSGLVGAGAPIIGGTEGLEQRFVPLLD